MKNILAISKITFKEAIRDKILYAILAFGILFGLLNLFLAKLALGDMVMIKSFGLAGIYIFGIVITIFLGASIIYKEIEKKTLYFVLSKPVSRSNIIVGKFFGLFAAVAFTTLLMALIYLAVIAYEGGGFDYLGLLAISFQMLEEAFFIAILIFFSSFSAPLTSTISALSLLFIGHLLDVVIKSAEQIGGVLHQIFMFLSVILPNLEKFNLRNLVVHNLSISFETALIVLGYALLYIILLLFCGTLLFKKREL